MLRRLLLQKIAQLDRPTPASVFVLLWDFFLRVGLSTAEAQIRELGQERHLLDPYGGDGPCTRHCSAALAELRELLGNQVQFDLLALRWLKRLDLELKDNHFLTHTQVELPGLAETSFLLKARNNWIADQYGHDRSTGPPGAKQGDAPSFFPYCLFHMAVPTTPIRGRRIRSRTGHRSDRWASPELQVLLLQEWERKHFSVLLWPFKTAISYAGVRLDAPLPNPGGFNPVRLAEVEDETALRAEVLQAIGAARELEVTILIFPELSMPAGIVAVLQEELGRATTSSRPLLTLLGACHCSQPGRANDLNEAILLGPDGTELHRHRKLTNFIHESGDGQIGERLDLGDTISVLESPIGNLVPLICLDFFHDTVRDSLKVCHGNTFLVPSLSPKTSAHREAAREYWRQRWVSSFVCNRWLATEGEMAHVEQSSFVRLGGLRRPEVDHWPKEGAERVVEATAPIARRLVQRTDHYLYFELG